MHVNTENSKFRLQCSHTLSPSSLIHQQSDLYVQLSLCADHEHEGPKSVVNPDVTESSSTAPNPHAVSSQHHLPESESPCHRQYRVAC